MQGKYIFAASLTILLLGSGVGACRKPDNDAIPTAWEKKYHLNPYDPSDATADKDGDGLNNLEEYKTGADPTEPDTDQDGITDGYEPGLGLSPANPDSDGDGDPDRSDCQAANPKVGARIKEGPLGTPSCVDALDNNCNSLTDFGDPGCACADNAQCPRSDPCQVPVCQNRVCRWQTAPEGSACDDGKCCTEPDQCQSGQCLGASKNCPPGQVCDPQACRCSPSP